MKYHKCGNGLAVSACTVIARVLGSTLRPYDPMLFLIKFFFFPSTSLINLGLLFLFN